MGNSYVWVWNHTLYRVNLWQQLTKKNYIVNTQEITMNKIVEVIEQNYKNYTLLKRIKRALTQLLKGNFRKAYLELNTKMPYVYGTMLKEWNKNKWTL